MLTPRNDFIGHAHMRIQHNGILPLAHHLVGAGRLSRRQPLNDSVLFSEDVAEVGREIIYSPVY